MKTRMERYYKTDEATREGSDTKTRTDQNQSVYEEVVNIDPYDENNQIDLTKLENIIKEQEKPHRSYEEILKINEQINEDLTELERELDKTFDINKIINKVKEETEVSSRSNKLYNTQYDLLNQIEIETETTFDEDDPEEKLQELFHTITSNSLLSQNMPTSELALDVLSDLKPTDESEVIEGIKERTVDTAPFSLSNAKSLSEIADARKVEENQDTREQAKDFFTGNIEIQANDFEDFSDLESAMQSNSKLIWVLVIILLVVIAGVGFYVYTNLLK